MKHLFVILALGFALASCTKNSTSEPVPSGSDTTQNQIPQYPSLIVAKWKQTADTTRVIKDGIVTSINGNGEAELYYQFNSDNTGTQTNVLGTTPMTYTLAKTDLTLNFQSANTQSQSVVEPATIRVLNETTLCLFFDENPSSTNKTTQVIWFKKI